MLKTLVSLGFADIDAEVYVFLANEGPQKASDIAEAFISGGSIVS